MSQPYPDVESDCGTFGEFQRPYWMRLLRDLRRALPKAMERSLEAQQSWRWDLEAWHMIGMFAITACTFACTQQQQQWQWGPRPRCHFHCPRQHKAAIAKESSPAAIGPPIARGFPPRASAPAVEVQAQPWRGTREGMWQADLSRAPPALLPRPAAPKGASKQGWRAGTLSRCRTAATCPSALEPPPPPSNERFVQRTLSVQTLLFCIQNRLDTEVQGTGFRIED